MTSYLYPTQRSNVRMSTHTPWLQHPNAVDRRYFVASSHDGAYHCKTNRGQIEIWHRSASYAVLPGGKRRVNSYDTQDPANTELVENTRKDPRHAIAAHLGCKIDDVYAEDEPDILRNISPFPKAGIGSVGQNS